MKQIYICYKHNGVPSLEIRRLIDPIIAELEKSYIVYCYVYNDGNNNAKTVTEEMLRNLNKSDYFIMVADIEFDHSMLLQFGYTLKKNIPKLLIVNEEIDNSIVHDMSEYRLTYKHRTDIPKIISKYNLFLYYKIREKVIFCAKIAAAVCCLLTVACLKQNI